MKLVDCSRSNLGGAYLCETLKCHTSIVRLWEELEEDFHDVALQDEAQGHPGKVGMKRSQGCFDEIRLLTGIEYKQAELMNEAELCIQGLLEIIDLSLHQMGC